MVGGIEYSEAATVSHSHPAKRMTRSHTDTELAQTADFASSSNDQKSLFATMLSCGGVSQDI